MYTIYDHPRDYPEKFVVRRCVVMATGEIEHLDGYACDTLEQARALVPPGLFCQPRQTEDDPVIVETWF
jgi:hypothetical protein